MSLSINCSEDGVRGVVLGPTRWDCLEKPLTQLSPVPGSVWGGIWKGPIREVQGFNLIREFEAECHIKN